LPVTLTVREIGAARDSLTLNLHAGWNTMSSNVIPQELSVPEVVQPLTEAGALTLMKDGLGRFYYPADNFINIPRWESADGYQMHLTRAMQLLMVGELVDLEQALPLPQGWSLKAYWRSEAEDPVSVLADIRDAVVIVKNGAGRFYWPEWDYSNLAAMQPGEGYWYLMREAADLHFHPNGRGWDGSPGGPPVEPLHFRPIATGDADASVLLLGAPEQAGWEAAAVGPSGEIAGAAVFDRGGRCGMAVRGAGGGMSAPDQVAGEGIGEGDTITFRLWDGTREYPATVRALAGSPVWRAGGLLAGEVEAGGWMPNQFGLRAAYPNPFNGSLRLEFSLETAGLTSLEIYDLAGRLVGVALRGYQMAGDHSVTWRADPLPAGLYLARLQQGERSAVVKVMLVK
jgi:hypothetical protein